MTESRLGRSALAGSCLAEPLPEPIAQRQLNFFQDQSEGGLFYEVTFGRAPGERPRTILVKLKKGTDGAFLVHADAFLDLFDDRPGAFAQSPVEGNHTFHALVDAYKHCFDERIPGHENKSFIKLRPHPRMAPSLMGYFDRSSPVAELFSNSSALPWGQTGVCTVTLAWNTGTPGQPYVELTKVEGFSWNPWAVSPRLQGCREQV